MEGPQIEKLKNIESCFAYRREQITSYVSHLLTSPLLHFPSTPNSVSYHLFKPFQPKERERRKGRERRGLKKNQDVLYTGSSQDKCNHYHKHALIK